jgi:hypothetical protein
MLIVDSPGEITPFRNLPVSRPAPVNLITQRHRRQEPKTTLGDDAPRSHIIDRSCRGPSLNDPYLREADFRNNALLSASGLVPKLSPCQVFDFSEYYAIIPLSQRSEA